MTLAEHSLCSKWERDRMSCIQPDATSKMLSERVLSAKVALVVVPLLAYG